MIVNEREKTIYKQGFMSGSNAAQTAIKAAEHRAEPYLGVPDDISKRLRDIASDIDDIATEIEAVARK